MCGSDIYSIMSSEKIYKGKKKIYAAFIHMQKAYDRVDRDVENYWRGTKVAGEL